MTRRSAGNERTLIMNQPVEPFRRRTTSGSKLAKLFRNESTYQSEEVTQLLSGLNQMVITSKLAAKGANAQLRGVEAIAKWAKRSRNSAIDDVMQRTSQLFQMYTEKQMQFSRDFDHFIQQLRKIADTERRVMEYEQDVERKEAKLLRVKKQIARSSMFWRKSSADFARLRAERDILTIELEQAHRRLNAAREEAEVVKMFQFRQGMMGIADAYRNLATNCNLIFGCQREITELVPAVSTQDVDRMLYDGTPYTRERVEEVRRSLDANEHPIVYNPPSARQRVNSIQNLNRASLGTPPPPYTPLNHQTLRLTERSRFSDSHLLTINTSQPATRIPRSSRSTSQAPGHIQPSAPESTPVRNPPHSRIYPDLNSLVCSQNALLK